MEKDLNKNKQIRIEEIILRLDEAEDKIKQKISEILEIEISDIVKYIIVKKAIDSRSKRNVFFVYSVDAKIKKQATYFTNLGKASLVLKAKIIRHKVRLHEPFIYLIKKVKPIHAKHSPVIIGSGPSGLFAALLLAKSGLKPLILERGQDVDRRIKDVEEFLKKGELNPESNIQFGEGGAGTFSDGKLYTLINDPRKKFIFEELIKSGAPAEIATDAHPHIGTDNIRKVVKNIRAEIIKLGGEFRFERCLTGLEIKNKKVLAAIINKKEKIKVTELILAIGHSSRDTYEMLYANKLNIIAKPFSIGLRIEHEANLINRAQYSDFYNHPKLSAARYSLVVQAPGFRPVYTFCMCPGGYVIAAASEKGGLVTNGMSEYLRNSTNSNSALLVNVMPSDFASEHPLAGVEFQRHWERQAFQAGGSNYFAPAQLVGDFLKNTASLKLKNTVATYRPGIKLGSLNTCLPDFILDSIRASLPLLDKKLKGFSRPEAILTGVETRSSSPIRILRDDSLQSNVRGIYPIGEGAGYAGGIVSSAIDGLRAAELIIDKYI